MCYKGAMSQVNFGPNFTFENFIDAVFSTPALSVPPQQIGNELFKDVSGKIVYGWNTGFGPMAQIYVGKDERVKLQYNLIRSHACGAGKPLSNTLCRAILIARLQTLSLGYSAVTESLLNAMQKLVVKRIHPVVYEHGSVGASGDLVQLAHIGLGLIGEGDVWCEGVLMSAEKALKICGLTPYELTNRDGLALINGTAAMTAIAAINISHAEQLLEQSIINSAVMYDICEVHRDIFDPLVGQVRPHAGQRYVIDRLNHYLPTTSNTRTAPLENIKQINDAETSFLTHNPQEIYSLRCVPQILGPIYDAINRAKQTVATELKSVTDNPIFGTDRIVHNGNFHGDYVSYEMDCLKIAITKLSLLLDRQMHFLLHERINQKFPPFLNANTPGLTLGLQGLQFVATSTAAENQTISNPMSVHSIPTNGDNQDVVSMGTNSALLAHKVVHNTFDILAAHTIAVVQATRLSGEVDSLPKDLLAKFQRVNELVPTLDKDMSLQPVLAKLSEELQLYPHT
ncbi:MAG: histidine ammonia-lyase [Candidatus Paceibacteria bacterium]|jgi:histidine ammonia-lyase